jgi:hypothetical protein
VAVINATDIRDKDELLSISSGDGYTFGDTELVNVNLSSAISDLIYEGEHVEVIA